MIFLKTILFVSNTNCGLEFFTFNSASRWPRNLIFLEHNTFALMSYKIEVSEYNTIHLNLKTILFAQFLWLKIFMAKIFRKSVENNTIQLRGKKFHGKNFNWKIPVEKFALSLICIILSFEFCQILNFLVKKFYCNIFFW